MLAALGLLTLAAWLYLCLLHGGYWRATERLPENAVPPALPAVVAIVPARDEAACIGRAVASLLRQGYPGPLRVVVVDDESTDGTASVAAAAGDDRLHVARTPPRPPGWVGKMWAVHHGVRIAAEQAPQARHLLLTDADIEHAPDNVERLVALAEARDLDLTSLMVALQASTGLERLLIPAFVYFFQMLYPFARVNGGRGRTAAAAGGCMLVRREALARAGGIEAVRGEVIDDCALARAIRRSGGKLWLGLGDSARSIRGYGGLRGVWRMVARTAFTQLQHSWTLLALTVTGLALVFLAAPVLLLAAPLHGDAAAAITAALAWALMAVSFTPTLALYGKPRWWGIALPFAALLYTAMTIDSARRHRGGRGAEWKGRALAGRAGA